MSDIAPAEQARRLASMRAAAPLPPPMVRHPASGAPGAPLLPAEAPSDRATDAQPSLPPAPVQAAPIDGVTVKYHTMPGSMLDETQVSRARQDEAIRIMRLCGYDPWRAPPDAREDLNAFNRSRINPVDQPPLTPIAELRAVLDVAKATLRAARQKANDAQRPVDRASADIALLERDIAAEAGLQRDTAECFAKCVADGIAPELDPVLARRVKQRDQAQTRLTALRAALGPLEAANVKAKAEVARAQTRAEAAALTILAAEADGMAAECVAARERWAKLRNDLLALGAVRMNGATPKLSYAVFLAVRDESQPPHLIDALVQQFTKRARALLADDADE